MASHTDTWVQVLNAVNEAAHGEVIPAQSIRDVLAQALISVSPHQKPREIDVSDTLLRLLEEQALQIVPKSGLRVVLSTDEVNRKHGRKAARTIAAR